jgi:hypothetical protein
MLFVVVLEFFLCWTPLYVINSWTLFDPKAVYQNLGYTAISFFQLLAYSSSCCNPITYCFMNIGFRKAFLNLFRCCLKQSPEPSRRVSLSGYGNAAPPPIASTLHSINIEKNINNNNNNILGNNSVSDNELSRQPSFTIHKQDNIDYNEIRCESVKDNDNWVISIKCLCHY